MPDQRARTTPPKDGASDEPSVPDLVVVGAASRDIDAEDPRGWRLGGSVAYGALLAARRGTRVGALVGADAETARADELQLLERSGVEVVLVELPRGPIFHNVETPRGREQVAHAPSDRMPAVALPDGWRAARAFLLGPVADELGDDWADVMPEDAVVALGWQGMLRRIVSGRPVEPVPPHRTRLVERADIASVSVEDLRAGGGDLVGLLVREEQELVVTADERGSLHLRRTALGFTKRRLPAVPARRTVDRTGAGDSFLTAWLLARMPGSPLAEPRAGPARPLLFAAVAGSLAVESYGLAGVPDRAALMARLEELRREGVPR